MLYMADAYVGKAHVTADQVGDYHAGISGLDCILNVGEKLRAEILSANKVRIYDGAFLFGGRRSGITAGSYEDVTIQNGTQAQKRNDLICAKYEKDSTTSKENLTFTVIKGTPGSTAADPSVPAGTIRGGSAVCYMPLYRAKLDGINLTGVERIPAVQKTAAEVEAEISALNVNLKQKMDALKVFSPKGIWCGTFTKSSYTGSTSVPLQNSSGTALTRAVLNNFFGVNYDANNAKAHYIAFAMNADGSICDAHISGAQWVNDGLAAVSESSLNGKTFRINWCVMLF